MTTGLTSMNGLYGTYGMQSYYNNPYFLQAYYSPNYNQMYGQQQMYNPQQIVSAQAGTNNSSATQLTGANNVNFKGAQSAITSEAKEEKKSNGLTWALGIGATAVGIGWWLASRGKSCNATGLWNQIKTGFKSVVSKPKILSAADDIAKHKDTLKLNEALKWTDDAAKLKGFQFELKDADGVLQKFAYNNDEIITKAYKDGKLSDTLKKQVDDIITEIKGKDIANLPSDVTLKNITYTADINIAVGFYRALTPDATNNLKFVRAYI